MLPGPIIIRECPHCAVRLRHTTWHSGNTFDSTLYSDGYLKADMLPQEVIVSKCKTCNQFFWIKDARVIEQENIPNRSLGHTYFLSTTEYLELLDSNFIKDESEEVFIRRMLWWKFNNHGRRRYRQPFSENDKADYENNIIRLQDLLGDTDEEKLTKAEILRNLRKFATARRILNSVSNESLMPIVNRMRRACFWRRQYVIPVDGLAITDRKRFEMYG